VGIMLKGVHGRLCIRALVISVVVNVLMIGAGVTGGVQEKSTRFARLSDIMAAPPGVIISRCCGPQQHTAGAFFVSIAEATVISILFYGVMALAVLEIVYWTKRVPPQRSKVNE
jgi:hypothetical protein